MAERRDRLSGRQLGALALTAAGLPVFRTCCRISWPWVLLGGLAAAATLSALTALLNRSRRGAQPAAADTHRPCSAGCQPAQAAILAAPLLLFGALLAAWQSTFSFPETAGSLPAAALVLGLALWAARIGPAAAGRCAGILLWTTGALYGTVLVFSLPQVRWAWLRPVGSLPEALGVWAALLTPGAALFLGPALGEDQRLPHWPWWAAAALAAAASAVTGGILSPALQPETEAFRTLARGVSVLGVIRRFEALVNGAMLMSGFARCTLYMVSLGSAFRTYSGRVKNQKKFGKMQKSS